MTTQARNDLQSFNPDRGRPDARATTAAEAVAESLMGPIFPAAGPAPGAKTADATLADRPKPWFTMATVLIILALAGCAAAAVSLMYGPVFTEPMIGP
jgi:hypothetical protein